MIWQIRLAVLLSQAVTEWSKRPGKSDRERKFWSTRFAHLWQLPSQGCWVSLRIGRLVLSPDSIPAISHMRSPQNRRLGHSPSFTHVCLLIDHTHKHTVELVKYRRKCVYWENRETRALSVLTLSWRSQMRPQDDSLRWTVSDLWSPQKKI